MGALKAGCAITRDLVLVRRLGAGGMATVWLAHHRRLDVEVVVKFLAESLVADADARARFSREVTATVQVRSPHVVQMLDHGITEGGVPFIVMELLEGGNLSKTMKDGSLRPDEVQHVIDGVAAALTKAHERGIVHRDIKPANIFMCSGNPRPFVKLVDFGIAKRLEDVTMTATHALLGTPAYMSPEQLGAPGAIDHRTDLWALGVLVYHMLTGKPPFRGAHIANIAHTILNEETPRLTAARPDLPAALDPWLFRALARAPADRFNSAQELADALAQALGDLAHSSTRRMQRNVPEHTMPLVGNGPPPAAGSGPALGVSPLVVPTPQGYTVRHRPSTPSAPSVPTFDGVGTTFGPSSITQSPYGVSARLKWWIMGTAAVGVLLIAGAFRIGYGLRRSEAPLFPPAAAAPAPPPPPSDPNEPLPVATQGTVIGASPDPRPAVPSASPIVRPGPASNTPKRLPGGRIPLKGGPRNDDDVGF